MPAPSIHGPVNPQSSREHPACPGVFLFALRETGRPTGSAVVRFPGRVAQPAQQVAAERLVGIHLSALPEPGVPGAAFFRGVAPRDRMVHANRAAVVAVLVDGPAPLHDPPGLPAGLAPLIPA